MTAAQGCTMRSVADHAAAVFGDEPAIVEGDLVVTFDQYVAGARSVAARLVQRHDVVPGERVAIWAPNGAAWAVASLGVHLAGASLVPVNTRFEAPEVARVLRDAGVRVVFCAGHFLGRSYVSEVDELIRSGILPASVSCVELDSVGALLAWSDAPSRVSASRLPAVCPDDPATVLFTSGTTGRPKGAVLRHGALVEGYRTWSGLTGLRRGDRVMATNPFFHAFGLNAVLLGALVQGATVYPVAVFEPAKVLDALERHRITYYPAPPTVFQELAREQQTRPRGVAFLRVCVTGATTIPPSLISDLRDVLGFEDVFVPYGFTEATGLATITRRGDSLQTVMTTAGRPLPDIEVQVRRADGSCASPGETGEIFVSGYVVMAGYLLPDGSITPPALEADALASGDLGHLDTDGNLVISGRSKDMIISGGFNVYPAEVEIALREHPAIEDVSVIGVPDERLGEVGCAVVVATPGSVDARSLRRWARGRLANFKIPRHVVLVDALPRNASGKVVKDRVVEQVRAVITNKYG